MMRCAQEIDAQTAPEPSAQWVITRNPDSIEYIVLLTAFYLHVGPFSRQVIGRIENMMAALEPSATSRQLAWSSLPTHVGFKLIGDIAPRENKETAD